MKIMQFDQKLQNDYWAGLVVTFLVNRFVENELSVSLKGLAEREEFAENYLYE